MLEDFELNRVESFFRKVANDRHPVSSLVITHLLAERPAFLRAITRVCKVAAALPKPKSVDDGALRLVQAVMPVDSLDRQRFADSDMALEYVESRAAGQRLILLDVGGYFAPCLNHLHARFSGELVGVVEDTENGHQLRDQEPGLHEVDHTKRSRIASLWLHYFEGRRDVSHA